MNLKTFLQKTYRDDFFVRKRVVCNNGLELSIQGSEFHYCEPRENRADGEYKTLEVNSFGVEIEDFSDYSDGTNYSYVPFELVEKVIENNGGIFNEL